MLRRNGGVTRVVVGVVAFFGLVYFIYLYNDLSGQLKNTEHSAERYRREQESVSAQLQDEIIAKDQLKQRCDNDKEQMTNRLSSIQQQYKMLKSQHEDMESEFGRLQNEKEKQIENHRKQDEERSIEYSQLKQEKSLEISSLRDTVANLEREKEQLSQQVFEMKTQLQNSLTQAGQQRVSIAALQSEIQTQKDLLQQSQSRQQQIEQKYQQLQQQHHQQQQQLLGQQENKLLDKNSPHAADVHGNQQPGNFIQGGMFQGVNQNQNQQQQQQQQQPIGGLLGPGLKQNVQDVLQGLKQHLPVGALDKILHGGADSLNPLLPGQPGRNYAQQNTVNQDNLNLADDILKSLQDKHRPLDSDLLEEEQKRHQVIPPGNRIQEYDQPRQRNDYADLGHQKHAQNMLGQAGHGVLKEQEVHQIGRPNFDDDHAADDTHGKGGYRDDLDAGVAVDYGNHDNRMQNQGPVHLQVQEPNLHGNIDKSNKLVDDDLKFQPHIPIPDNQIQPHLPVDDSQRQEQLDIPFGKDKTQEDGRDEDDRLDNRNMPDDDDDAAHLPMLGRAGMI